MLNVITLEEALALVEREFVPAAVAEPENLDARTKMSYASVLGMMAYTQGGGLYAHSASYIITLQKFIILLHQVLILGIVVNNSGKGISASIFMSTAFLSIYVIPE